MMPVTLINQQLLRSSSGKFQIVASPIDGIGPGEMIVRILAVGVCGTDKQILRQQRDDSATILGHEGVGHIFKVDAQVQGFYRGQVVVFNPVNPFNQDIILGHSTSGVLQRYRVISEDEVRQGLVVPIALSPVELGVLAEPLGAAIYANELAARFAKVRKLAIAGAGPEGLLNVLYATGNLAYEVFLIHNDSSRLKWVAEQQMLPLERMFLDSDLLVSDILSATHGEGVDATILCTSRRGALAALRKALLYTREKGCIDLTVGFDSQDRLPELPSLDLNAIRKRNLCGCPTEGSSTLCHTSGRGVYLTGHRGTSQNHIIRAVEVLAANPILYQRLITHRVAFPAAPNLLQALAEKNSLCSHEERQLVKAIICFPGGD